MLLRRFFQPGIGDHMDLVLIGGCRCGVLRQRRQCRLQGAAALAQPVNDTLKRANADLLVSGSVDRHQLYAMQTPQIFERKLLEDAYRAVYAEEILVTDEVSAVERLGKKVALVLNENLNFKITYPRDLPVAEFVLRERANAAP